MAITLYDWLPFGSMYPMHHWSVIKLEDLCILTNKKDLSQYHFDFKRLTYRTLKVKNLKV